MSGGDHFYTIDQNEAANFVNNLKYVGEGIAAYVYPSQEKGTVPLHRLYHGNDITDHFYTIDKAEADVAVAQHGYTGSKMSLAIQMGEIALRACQC